MTISGQNTEFSIEVEKLNTDIKDSESTKEQLQKAKTKAEHDLKKAATIADKQAAQQLFEIEAYRVELAEYSHNWFVALKSIFDKYVSIEQKIVEIENTLENRKMLNDDEILVLYSKIKQHWRTLIDDGTTVYNMVKDQSKLGVIEEKINNKNKVVRFGVEGRTLSLIHI